MAAALVTTSQALALVNRIPADRKSGHTCWRADLWRADSRHSAASAHLCMRARAAKPA